MKEIIVYDVSCDKLTEKVISVPENFFDEHNVLTQEAVKYMSDNRYIYMPQIRF